MSQSNISALLFSADEKFRDAIEIKLFENRKAYDDELGFVYVADLANVSAVSNVDVVVYDLDLAKGDLVLAREHVLRIKAEQPETPLIMVGEVEALVEAQSSKRVASRVAKSVKKQAPVSQLLMAVMAVTAKSVRRASNRAKDQRRLKSVMTSLAASLALVASLVFLLPISEGNTIVSKLGVNDRSSASKFDSELSSRSTELQTQNDKQVQEVERLSNLVKTTLDSATNITANTEDVLGYLNQILEIDQFNVFAYQSKWNIVNELRTSFPRLLKDQNLDEASKIVTILREVEPFNLENDRMSSALKLASSQISTKRSNAANKSGSQPAPDKSGVSRSEERIADKERLRTAESDSIVLNSTVESEAPNLEKQINNAIAAKRFVPPVDNNAYDLLRKALQESVLDAATLSKLKNLLLSKLVPLANEDIAASNLGSATNKIKYISSMESGHPSIGELNAKLLAQRSQLSLVNQKDVDYSTKLSAVAHAEKQLALAKSAAKQGVNGVIPFEILTWEEPKYPKRARALDVEGWVELAYQVDQNGDAVNIKVIKGEPRRMFDKSGVQALKNWRFKPAVNANTGEAVLSAVNTTTFKFDLGS